MSDQKEEVNHPSRYNAGSVECIDAIESALTPEEYRGFIKGTVIRYVWREKHKGRDQDLQKAAWYVKRLLAYEEKREPAPELDPKFKEMMAIERKMLAERGFGESVLGQPMSAEKRRDLAEDKLRSLGYYLTDDQQWVCKDVQYSALIEGCGRITADKETVDKINARIEKSKSRDIEIAKAVRNAVLDSKGIPDTFDLAVIIASVKP